MTRRKVVRPVTVKYDRLKSYLLMGLQSILGALVVVCIFLYRMSTALQIGNSYSSYSFTPSFQELRGDYYESKIYTTNLSTAVYDILRYVVISEQFESGEGVYSPNKIINIGSFAHRHDDTEYEGPDAEYYLDDLLKWGRGSIVHEAKVFFSWEDYNKFFNNEITEYELLDTEEQSSEEAEADEFYISGNGDELIIDSSDKKVVAVLDTVKNTYLTVNGLKLEEVVHNSEDYNELAICLEKTINSLASNYAEYMIYKEIYDNESTNIQYYASVPTSKGKMIFTNDNILNITSADSSIAQRMRQYGEFVYVTPGGLGYLTNTPLQYRDIEEVINNNHYLYAFPKNSYIWIALNNTYPVDDIFKKNFVSYNRGAEIIPWVISFGLLSFIGFIAIFVYMFMHLKKKYNYEGAKDDLRDFDKLPFEITVLFFVLLVFALVLGESIIVKSIDNYVVSNMTQSFIPVSVLMGIDLFIILIFVYGFVRRIICNNLFEGSLLSFLSPVFNKIYKRLKRVSDNIYDDSGLIVKVWVGYILFLLLNLLITMLSFLGNANVLLISGLIIFDLGVGVGIYKRNIERRNIKDGVEKINSGEYEFQFDLNKMHGINRELAREINNIGQGISKAVETSIKDEKLKADLITNVSHDIKTPLTSIINYVDILKKEKIDNENVEKYLKIIDDKAQRLRQLTFDLVEASKITSGNISLDIVEIDFVELLGQTLGEFEDKFKATNLTIVLNVPDKPVIIDADPRRMWRVIENLFNNICKYSLEGTRVYVDLVVIDEDDKSRMYVSVKNVSRNELNIPADELTERFIRGDVSRSTEGSGLGLSIAKSLTIAQAGEFYIYLDGDLFKVTLSFPVK